MKIQEEYPARKILYIIIQQAKNQMPKKHTITCIRFSRHTTQATGFAARRSSRHPVFQFSRRHGFVALFFRIMQRELFQEKCLRLRDALRFCYLSSRALSEGQGKAFREFRIYNESLVAVEKKILISGAICSVGE